MSSVGSDAARRGARLRGGTRPHRRIAERRHQVLETQARRRRHRLALALALALVVAGSLVAMRSPLFGLSAIDVHATRHVSRAQVLAVAGVHLGAPVFSLDLAAITERVETLPWVAHATVERVFPAAIAIDVTQRRVAASITDGVGDYWLVAPDGIVLEKVASRPVALPDLSAVPVNSSVVPGVRVAGDGAFTNALAALGGLSPALSRMVVSVQAPSVDGLSFGLRGGVRLVYGAASDQAAKNAATFLMLAQAKHEHSRAVQIDVRSPYTPTLLTA